MPDIPPTNPHIEPTLPPGSHQPPHIPLANGLSMTETLTEEDDSVISCICGFPDDDGHTVLCEECNTWQHIDCYYPNKHHEVPDIHQCVKCHFRPIDAKAAADRQRQSRAGVLPGEKKTKRPQARSHKKKVKDTVTPKESTPALSLVNGSTHTDKVFNHDRASGSSHDPPPAKRPKTSHRASSSTASINNKDILPVASRKRTNSLAVNMGSPTKNPASPILNGHPAHFTQDFMQLYDKEFTPTRTNSFSNLSVSNDLSTWLNDIEQFQAVTNGKTQNNVLKRWDQPWENLEQASPGYTVKKEEDTNVRIHGRHPTFYYVIANNVAMPGSYIGEINGQIGRISDYKADPSSKWSVLSHPEPFVYFHGDLPIYIDTRYEGSELRFVRRSCQPNSKIEIIIVGQAYHFCLVTDKEIDSGEQITISWTFEERFTGVMRRIWEKKAIRADEADYIKTYLSNLKANFGGCACDPSQSPCLLEKMLDRATKELNFQPPKTIRKKGKRGLNQVSPLSTGAATNSRAGSEAVNQMDVDDDLIDDNRSVSGSARSKPSSRDITPAIATEASVGLGLELSTREQRKLQQAERMFEKMENDKGGRKRNSGGSNLNTPTISTSKRLGHDISPKPSLTPTNIGRSTIKPIRRSMPNGVTNHDQKSKPAYSDMTTQTEEPISTDIVDMEVVDRRRQRGCSFALKLLRRTRKMQSTSKEGTPSPSRTVSPSSVLINRTETFSVTPADEATRAMPPPPPPAKTPQPVSPVLPKEEVQDMNDVEMKDVETSPKLIEPVDTTKEESPQITTPTIPAQPPTPSPTIEQKEETSVTIEAPVTKPVLHVPLPPPPNFSIKTQLFSPVSGPTTPQPNGVTSALTTPGHNALFSPTLYSPTTMISNAPLMSPSLSGPASAASPVKKKLSLSDWSNRNKKKVQEAAAQAAQSSPLATAAPLSAKPLPEESADGAEKENLPVHPSDQSINITGQVTSDEPMQVDVHGQSSTEMDVDTKEQEQANVT